MTIAVLFSGLRKGLRHCRTVYLTILVLQNPSGNMRRYTKYSDKSHYRYVRPPCEKQTVKYSSSKTQTSKMSSRVN